MNSSESDKYEILRQLAVAGSRGEELQATAQAALREAAGLVGLKAAMFCLWDDNLNITMSVTHADGEPSRNTLTALEKNILIDLRKDHHLLSAYMSFDSNPPLQSFTHPIKTGSKTIGAVIGIGEGERTVIAENLFIEALCAGLSLAVLSLELTKGTRSAKDNIEKERLGAVLETAVTVNHEINNPLTAILGNVQLLLLKRQDLDDDLKTKLKTIETSALKIKDVTQRLLRLTSVRSVEYTEGTSMLDLSDDKEK